MKFSLVQSELNRSLQLVAGVVPGKTSNPQHLTSVRIEATPEGKLTFTGTDLDLFLVTTVHGTVEEPGIASIPARRLLEIVKELPADVVQIASTASGISVVCGNGRFRLVGPDPLEFPPVPEMSQDKVFAVETTVLSRLINQSSYAVATDYTRAEQTAVYVHVVNGELRFVATNGHRLAQAMHPGEYPPWGDILVPPKALSVLQRLMAEGQDSVSMSASKRFCLFNLGTSRLYTRLLEGSFPPYEQAIPGDCDKRAVVDRGVLASALRRVSVFTETGTKMIRLALEKDTIRLSAQSHDVGHGEEPMPATYDGPPFQIGFNAAYILELLRTMDGEEVELAFKDPTSAGVFTPIKAEGRPDVLCLVMPLRLPDEVPAETAASLSHES